MSLFTYPDVTAGASHAFGVGVSSWKGQVGRVLAGRFSRRGAEGRRGHEVVLLLVLEAVGSRFWGNPDSSTSTALRAEYEYEYDEGVNRLVGTLGPPLGAGDLESSDFETSPLPQTGPCAGARDWAKNCQ